MSYLVFLLLPSFFLSKIQLITCHTHILYILYMEFSHLISPCMQRVTCDFMRYDEGRNFEGMDWERIHLLV
jgi:hypothetical protein